MTRSLTGDELRELLDAVSSAAIALLAFRRELRDARAQIMAAATADGATDEDTEAARSMLTLLVPAIALADAAAIELEELTGEPVEVRSYRKDT